MKTAPTVGHLIYSLTKYILESLNIILVQSRNKHQKMTANVTCELELTEYDRRGSSQHKKLGRHESKVDIVMDSGWVT